MQFLYRGPKTKIKYKQQTRFSTLIQQLLSFKSSDNGKYTQNNKQESLITKGDGGRREFIPFPSTSKEGPQDHRT